MTPLGRAKRRTVLVLGVVLAIMLGLVWQSPTLYRLFCGATGINGTVQRVAADTARTADRVITVRFNTDVDPALPWRFRPLQDEVSVHLGEQKLVYFEAENLSDKAIVGHAAYNVTPLLAGQYFKKIQCFCFTDEKLGAHQKVDMPVTFFVDPAIAKDKTAGTFTAITLSYTFFPAKTPAGAQDLARFGATTVSTAIVPDATRGAHLFSVRCTVCHSLGQNRVGPRLGGVYGRKAGTAPGYDYSSALKNSGIVWNKVTLDHWLSGPTLYVPGARMPVNVPDPQARADIIAFLSQISAKTQAAK